MIASSITQDLLKDILDYDRETGVFTSKIDRRKWKIGTKVGNKNVEGYMRVTINKKNYYLHHLAWMFEHGEMPQQIDHINRDRSDNRISNLRNISMVENSRNRNHGKKSKTGVVGVTKTIHGTFRVKISGKHVATVSTLEEAKAIREQKEQELGYINNEERVA